MENFIELFLFIGVEEIDLIFFKGIMENFIVKLFVKVYERFEDLKLEVVSDNNLELVNEIFEDIIFLISVDENVVELVGIFKEFYF